MTDLLVIGGASLDTLHFGNHTAQAAGGAGMYTALAATRAGVSAAMLAPYPEPMPKPLLRIAQKIEWLGPLATADDLPHFEIAHHGNGKAELVQAEWGAEARMTPDDLPDDLAAFALVHIAALGTAQRQANFLRACRERGAQRISVGTYARIVSAEKEIVRALFASAEIFFMNENEAIGLFGSLDEARTRAGALLFITLGARGALVYQGEHRTQIPGIQVNELDPTGAGDTFCGATLAALVRGEHPSIAAQSGVALAAQEIQAIGPTALLHTDSPPRYPRDPRAVIDRDQITRVAELIRQLADVTPFDFIGEDFPPAQHPAALDYFFAATLQQFGFWNLRAERYHQPLLATLEGAERKGSDYLWRAYWGAVLEHDEFCTPPHQALLSKAILNDVFRADDGTMPMPALDLHLACAHAYGRDLAALKRTPAEIVAYANASPTPLKTFLQTLDRIGGYKEDPLRKKSTLLALILRQRPEKFLRASDEPMPPVIDYHLMRSCLRMGLVDVRAETLRRAVIARHVITASDEWAIRRAAFDALNQIVQVSGKSMGAVDWFMFNARHRCPEMTTPDCAHCAVDPVCAHRTELFQPVFRTTYY